MRLYLILVLLLVTSCVTYVPNYPEIETNWVLEEVDYDPVPTDAAPIRIQILSNDTIKPKPLYENIGGSKGFFKIHDKTVEWEYIDNDPSAKPYDNFEVDYHKIPGIIAVSNGELNEIRYYNQTEKKYLMFVISSETDTNIWPQGLKGAVFFAIEDEEN